MCPSPARPVPLLLSLSLFPSLTLDEVSTSPLALEPSGSVMACCRSCSRSLLCALEPSGSFAGTVDSTPGVHELRNINSSEWHPTSISFEVLSPFEVLSMVPLKCGLRLHRTGLRCGTYDAVLGTSVILILLLRWHDVRRVAGAAETFLQFLLFDSADRFPFGRNTLSCSTTLA